MSGALLCALRSDRDGFVLVSSEHVEDDDAEIRAGELLDAADVDAVDLWLSSGVLIEFKPAPPRQLGLFDEV